MASITKSEVKAAETSKAIGARQKAKLAKAKPSKAELAARSAAAVKAAKATQPKDDKQRRTMGVVARGHSVKTSEGYKRPGQFVTASAPEIESMRARGVLVDEGRVAIPMGREGPRVLQEDAAAKGAKEG